MSDTLSKTGILFGVIIFYVLIGFFLGMIDTDTSFNEGKYYFKDFGDGLVTGYAYDSTHILYTDVSLSQCNNNDGEFGILDATVPVGQCLIAIGTLETNENNFWSFTKFSTNISQLGWLNIILFVPLIGLIAFMFATSNPLIKWD